MKLNRIISLLYRDLLIIRRSKWRIVELIYFPVTTILIWGFFSIYSKSFSPEAGLIILIINIFWNFAYFAQNTANMQIMEDVWSGSLKQLLVSGISEIEYMLSRIVTASIISLLVLAIMVAISFLFSTALFYSIPQFLIISALTLIISLAMSVMISALIVFLGKSYGFLAWTALQAFVFLSAPFFPKETFPEIVQYISLIMPYTFIFEAARALPSGVNLPIGNAVIVAVAYTIVVWPFYIYMFRLARKKGNLVRLS